jgi:hypothetical protein
MVGSWRIIIIESKRITGQKTQFGKRLKGALQMLQILREIARRMYPLSPQLVLDLPEVLPCPANSIAWFSLFSQNLN